MTRRFSFFSSSSTAAIAVLGITAFAACGEAAAQDRSPIHQITLRNDTGGPVNDLHVTYNGRPPGGTLLNPGGRQNRGYGGEVGGTEYRTWPSTQGWTIPPGGRATLEWREGITARRARRVEAADWTLDGNVVGPATMVAGGLEIQPRGRQAVAQLVNESTAPLLFSNIHMVRDNTLANFTEEAFDSTDGQDISPESSYLLQPGQVEEIAFGDVDESLYQFISADVSNLTEPDVTYLTATAAVTPEPGAAGLLLTVVLSFGRMWRRGSHA